MRRCASAHVTNCALIGVLSKLQPSLMQPLLRRIVFDVPHLTDYSKMPLKVDKEIADYYSICENILVHQVKMIHLIDFGQCFHLPALDQSLRAEVEVLLTNWRAG